MYTSVVIKTLAVEHKIYFCNLHKYFIILFKLHFIVVGILNSYKTLGLCFPIIAR